VGLHVWDCMCGTACVGLHALTTSAMRSNVWVHTHHEASVRYVQVVVGEELAGVAGEAQLAKADRLMMSSTDS
jgi:hypothetical protein